MVTLKTQSEDRTVTENCSTNRNRRSKDNYRPSNFHAKNVYYNSHHRNKVDQQEYYSRPTGLISNPYRPAATYYHQDPTIRPLMEIDNDFVSLHQEYDRLCRHVQQREAKQRGQYRNRKAELDWDHAFDLDLIDFYKTNIDLDNYSLTSTMSSSDHSFSI